MLFASMLINWLIPDIDRLTILVLSSVGSLLGAGWLFGSARGA